MTVSAAITQAAFTAALTEMMSAVAVASRGPALARAIMCAAVGSRVESIDVLVPRRGVLEAELEFSVGQADGRSRVDVTNVVRGMGALYARSSRQRMKLRLEFEAVAVERPG
jgi:hypothetical protein